MPAFLEVLEKVRERMPGVTHLVGVENMTAANTRPGDVVWVPSTDVYGAPKTQGRPRARWTCTEAVQVAAWGRGDGRVTTPEEDMKAAKALAMDVLFAIEDVLNGSYRLSSGSWEANAPKTQLGRWYVLALEFDAPVTRPEPRVTVTAVETETELAPASGNDGA